MSRFHNHQETDRTNQHRSTPQVLAATAAVGAGILVWSMSPGWAAAIQIIALAVVLESMSRRNRATLSSTTIAAAFDARLEEGTTAEPTALILLDIRGLEVESLIGDSDVSEMVDVISNRLVADSSLSGALVARTGTIEFAVLVDGIEEEAAASLAEHLIVTTAEPVIIGSGASEINTVACVNHIPKGSAVTGDQVYTAAEAALRMPNSEGSPLIVVDKALQSSARRIRAVQQEVRESIQNDLLTTHVVPIFDVGLDEVVGLKSTVDWTSASRVSPDLLNTVYRSLGLGRAIETQYLLRAISAANSIPFGHSRPWVTATISQDRIADPQFLSKIDLLLRVAGVDPQNLILELEDLDADSMRPYIQPLIDKGMGVGISVRAGSRWPDVPKDFQELASSYCVSTHDITSHGEITLEGVVKLETLTGGRIDRIVMSDVDTTSLALDLGAIGLRLQTGSIHGSPMTTRTMNSWLQSRPA